MIRIYKEDANLYQQIIYKGKNDINLIKDKQEINETKK